MTPHVPSGATSRSFIWPGSASNCCRIRPSGRTAARRRRCRGAPPRWGVRGTRSTSRGRPSGTRAGPADRSPGRRTRRTLLALATSTAVVPSSESTALRSSRGPGAVPCTAVSRRLPSTRSTSISRHVACGASPGPATSSRARRPSGSTTAPIGSPPTSAPLSTSRTAPSASTVRTHGPDSPVPAVSTRGSVGDAAVARQPDQSSSASRMRRGSSAESTGQLEELAGDLVADEDRPAAVGEGAERPVAADGHRADHAAVLDERAQQRVPRLRGVPQPEPLDGQQVGQVQRLGGAGQGREPVRVGDQRGVLGHRRGAVGRPLGAHGQHGRHQRDHEHGGQSGGQPSQPASAAGLGPGPLLRGAQLRVGARLRRVEELALPGGQLVVRRQRPSRGPRRAGRRGTARRPGGRGAATPARRASGAGGRRGRRRRRPATGSGAAIRSAAPRARRRAARRRATAAAAPRSRRSPSGARPRGRRPGRARRAARDAG